MKQKIVLKVAMDCDKCRRRALKIAAAVKGVSSVSLAGADKDQVAVTGDEVDSVCLAKRLRKKFGHATITSVEPVKEDGKEKTKEEKNPLAVGFCYSQCPPCPVSYQVVYDPDPTICTIL